MSSQLTSSGYVDGNNAFLFGIDPSTYSQVTNGLNIVDGSMLSGNSSTNQIVLDNTFAQNLGVTIGSVVTVGSNATGGANYAVVGLYSTGTTFGPAVRSAFMQLSNVQKSAMIQAKLRKFT